MFICVYVYMRVYVCVRENICRIDLTFDESQDNFCESFFFPNLNFVESQDKCSFVGFFFVFST